MRCNKEHFSITADRFSSLSVPPRVRDGMVFWQLVVAAVDYSDGDGDGRFETQNLENAKRILAKLGPPVSLDVEWGHGIHAHASVCPFRNLALGDWYSYTEKVGTRIVRLMALRTGLRSSTGKVDSSDAEGLMQKWARGRLAQ